MALCLTISKKCQNIEAKLDYGFDWTQVLARKWSPDKPFDPGVTVRPLSIPTGFEYLSAGGQSAAEEPAWPIIVGDTVVDGSILWTCQLVTTTSYLETIVSDTWSPSLPTGLQVDPAAPVVSAGLQETKAVCSLGVVGEEYTVENEIVTNLGLEYVGRLLLTIEG